MTKRLILFGLIVIPFITGFHIDPILPLFKCTVRQTKVFFSLGICISIFLSALYNGELKAIKNKWLLMFVGLAVISPIYFPSFYTPHVKAGWWQYYPIFQIMVSFLAMVAVASLDFSKDEIDRGINVVINCAIIMSGLILIQKLNIDQFFIIAPIHISHGLGETARLVGTIGHPTWCAAYLAILAPIALYKRRFLASGVMYGVIWLLSSQMAVGASGIGVLLVCLIKTPKIALSLTLCTVLTVGALMIRHSDSIQFNGRLGVWSATIKDFLGPQELIKIEKDFNKNEIEYAHQLNKRKYCLTGLGWGSFKHIVSKRIEGHFTKVHNEYLELTLHGGFIGLALFLGSLLHIYGLVIFSGSQIVVLMLFVFTIILLISFGVPMFQTEPMRFYSIIIAGLLHNRSVLNGTN